MKAGPFTGCQLPTLARAHFCNLRGIAGKCCSFEGINVDWCICAMSMHCPFPLDLYHMGHAVCTEGRLSVVQRLTRNVMAEWLTGTVCAAEPPRLRVVMPTGALPEELGCSR